MLKAGVTETKKRKAPDFTGVKGELVSIANLNLDFRKKARISPYDELLDKLSKAGHPNIALKFGDIKAKRAISGRAKKKGMVLGYAEHLGYLYVSFLGFRTDSVNSPCK